MPRMRVLRSPANSKHCRSEKALVELRGAQIGLRSVSRRRRTVRRLVDGRLWKGSRSPQWVPLDDWPEAEFDACTPFFKSDWWMQKGWWIREVTNPTRC